MITPMVHRVLRRDDLARLAYEICQADPSSRAEVSSALQSGEVDRLLDSPVSLDIVRGSGGAPAPLPLALLWYIPVRASMLERGHDDVDLADYAASLPLAFLASAAMRSVARGDPGIATWWRSISSLPEGTVVQAERAAYCGALALWWAGCFPEWVGRRGGGPMMVRAYTDFAGAALRFSSRLIKGRLPYVSSLYARVGSEVHSVRASLEEARVEYLGRDAHTADGRLNRYLRRLAQQRETEED